MSSRGTSQQKIVKACEQFVLSVYRLFENNPSKLRIFIGLFHKNKKSNTKIHESLLKLVDLIQDYPDLVEQLNKLVPDEFKIKKLPNQDSGMDDDGEPGDIAAIMKELHSRRPEKVTSLIEVIQGIKNTKSEKNNKEIREKLTALLEDEPTLLNLFIKQLKLEEPLGARDEELEMFNENSNSMGQMFDFEEDDYLKSKPGRIPKTHIQKKIRGKPRGKRPEMENTTQNVMVKEVTTTTLPPTIRNELYLFEYLQNNLSTECYNELMKIIFLYNECIISSSEVLNMAKPIFDGNENYFQFFHEIIFTRESTRRKLTTLFKPLNEIDFKSIC